MNPGRTDLVDYLVETTSRLVRFRTFGTATEDHEACAQYLREQLSAVFPDAQILDAERLRAAQAGPVVIGGIATLATSRIHLHLNGHFDVVPPGDGWDADPFTPRLINGRIYGRGTADMKGGLAVLLAALRTIRADNPDVLTHVSASFVPDEEQGGHRGTAALTHSGILPTPNLVIVAEPTLPALVYGHNGVLQALIEVSGRASHAARPWLGKNAFDAARTFASTLREVFDSSWAGRANAPTMVLGGVATSGEAINVVPGKFRFSVDRRIRPWETVNDVRQEFLAACETAERKISDDGFTATCTIVNEVRPFASAPDDPVICMALKIARDVGDLHLQPELLAGFMDLGHFAQAGVRTGLALGPGRNDQPHVANESVAVSDLAAVTDAITAIIIALVEDTRRAQTSTASDHH